MAREAQLSDRASIVGLLAIAFIFVGLVLLSPWLFDDADAVIGPMVVGTVPPVVPVLMILVGAGLARLVKRMNNKRTAGEES